jgi:hypothetical protein
MKFNITTISAIANNSSLEQLYFLTNFSHTLPSNFSHLSLESHGFAHGLEEDDELSIFEQDVLSE